MRKILFSLIIFSLLAPVLVFAQGDPILKAANEFGDLNENRIKLILISIAEWFLILLGVIAVIMVLYSSFLFMTGGGNEEQTGKAKKILIWAMVGILVAIVSFSIVSFTGSLLDLPAQSGGGNPPI